MDTTNRLKISPILGIDESIPQNISSSTTLINWTVDTASKGWDNRIGYESVIPAITSRGDWGDFQNGGPVQSVYFWAGHGGAKSYLLFEQEYANSVSKTFPSDSNKNMSLHYWKGSGTKVTIDDERTKVPTGEISTFYNVIGKYLIITSGNGKPIKWDGTKVMDLGFITEPSPPYCWNPNPYATAGISDSTVMPLLPHSFNLDKSFGLGSTTTGDTNTYRYKVSFVMENGSESPLSAPSNMVTWITPNAVSAIFDNRKQVIFLKIPKGGDGVVARKIYRTKNLGEGDASEVYYYCDVIKNNNEDTYTDSIKDTLLGAVAPDASASILFPSPGTRFSTTFKNCLFIDGGSSDPTKIYYSQPLKADQFAALDFFDVGTKEGGDVTGFCSYYNNLIVFREKGIDLIRGDTVDGFVLTPFIKGIGTKAIHTISIVPEAGVIFFSEDGVYSIYGGLDGGSELKIQKLSTSLIDIFGRINHSLIHKAVGAYSPKWREYHVYFASDGSEKNSLGLVLHLDKGSWSIRSGFPVGCITVDNNGEFIFGHNVGQYTHTPVTNTGLVPDETGLFFISKYRNAGHTATFVPNANPLLAGTYTISENGAPTSIWISATHDFSVAPVKKMIKNIYISTLTEGSNLYNIFYYKDYSDDKIDSNEGLSQRPEYVEQPIWDASKGGFVYGPATSPATTPYWTYPLPTTLKFPVACSATSYFSFGIETSQDFILLDYTIEFSASTIETKTPRPKSHY